MDKKQQKQHLIDIMQKDEELGLYDESKQETLEEAAKNYNLNTINAFGDYESFIAGAKWQQKTSYSEEEVIDIAKQAFVLGKDFGLIGTFKEWFNTVKKK